MGEEAIAEEGGRAPPSRSEGAWTVLAPTCTCYMAAFFSLCSAQGISFLWPNNVGNLCSVLSQLQEAEMGGTGEKTQSVLTIQPFPTPGFQFLGYWLAGILSCLSRDPGSFSLCLNVNQYVSKERTVNQKLFFSKGGGSGSRSCLSAVPLLGVLNKFELINSDFFLPCVSSFVWEEILEKILFYLFYKRFSFGFLLFREIVLKL